MSVRMLAQQPYAQFSCRSGNQYTADANGVLATVATIDIQDMVVSGCIMTEPGEQIVQFGSGAGYFFLEGNVYRVVGNPISGNAADTTDDVLAVYTLPAATFDQAGRGGCITASFKTGATTNNKRAKILWGCTSAVAGGAVVGGTVIADTGAWVNGTTPNSAAGWQLQANVFKYGINGSNTQIAQGTVITGTLHGGIAAPVALTAPENATIIIAVTGSSYTTGAAGDVNLSLFEVNAMN